MQYLYNGGLQIRSHEAEDNFYNIDTFVNGEFSLHKLYPDIKVTDIPIAQDCFGDQLLIRDEKVIKLYAESGEIEDII